MKIATKVNDVSLKCYVYAREVLPFLMLGFVMYCVMSSNCFADGGVNRLAGLRGDVAATFGAGSDTEYYLYLGEALMIGMAWMKTKNIMVFGGLPLLMVFTHWALK